MRIPQTKTRISILRMTTLMALPVAAALYFVLGASAATTFTVTNTDDSGAGSLRQAILDANANAGTDNISFAIGSGAQTIIPLSALPEITDPVVIDGTTQPGFAGDPLIVLQGSSAGADVNGLMISGGSSTVKGLVINSFNGAGIRLTAKGGNVITGNLIGTDVTGMTAMGNGYSGLYIESSSPTNTIGGTTAAERNVVSGQTGSNSYGMRIGSNGNILQGNYVGTNKAGSAPLSNTAGGILMSGSTSGQIGGTTAGAGNVISGNQGTSLILITNNIIVQGNLIGTNAAGTASIWNAGAAPGAEGILINGGDNNVIGGTDPAARNVISGAGARGIRIAFSADGNSVLGNYIGTDITGTLPIPNGASYPGTQPAVSIESSSVDNSVGGTAAGSRNLIAFNRGVGVSIISDSKRNKVLGNSIHSNAGLGIDLNGDGVTANDSGDGDTGSNDLQNAPVLTSSVASGGSITITGTFNSTPSTTFRLEFFASDTSDASCNGEGQTFIGSADVTTDGSGNATINSVFAVTPEGQYVSATATDPTNNTSEFSNTVGTNGATPGTLQLSAATYSVGEGDGTATITVTRSGGTIGPASVNYATSNGTATAPSDYTATSGTLVLANGETSKQFTIPITNNSTYEVAETVNITLSSPSSCPGLGSQTSAVLTINDDDSVPSLSISDVSQAEGNGGTVAFVFTVTKTGATSQTVTVNYATADGTATAGSDYQQVSGSLTFSVGQTSRQVTVFVYSDTANEADETFSVNLSNAANASISDSTGLGTITNDDSQPTLSINDVSVNEGNSGTTNATFTVTLSAASGQAVTVDYATSAGTATSGVDYQPASGTLTFNPGETTKQVTVPVNGETTEEPNETFNVVLSNPANASISDSTGVGTIINDDAAPQIEFASATYNVNEDATSVTLTVNRTGDASGTATVNYTTSDGSALQKSDMTIGLGTLTFAPGETSKQVTVLISEDSYLEGAESFTVTLSNVTGAQMGAKSTATVSIDDDAVEPLTNVIDDAEIFVRQHYHDFLNRDADQSGLTFWKNEIASCGNDANCIDVKRNNVSAAFFLSIEFQQTGYFVHRAYNAALNRTAGLPEYIEFLRDTQTIQRGVVVGQGNWEQQLDQNKTAYAEEMASRAEFVALYPLNMTAAQYVDALIAHAQITMTPEERQAAIDEFNTPAGARGRALRRVVEHPELTQREFNRAFVLMQYFGYLRRHPSAAPDNNLDGFNYWLNKLISFGGNYLSSEMVRSFLVSGEYRNRFGLQ